MGVTDSLTGKIKGKIILETSFGQFGELRLHHLSPLRKVFFAEIPLETPIDFQRIANL